VDLNPFKHYEHIQRIGDYGRRPALIVSLGIHLVVLLGLVWMGMAAEKPDDFGKAITVKLGGPKNLKMGGAKTKAPVAGKTKAKPKATQKKPKQPPKKTRRKPKPKEVGLSTKKKPPPQKQTPVVADEAETEIKSSEKPDPGTETTEQISMKARGNVREGSDKGVSIEFGDGNEDVNINDIMFRTYLMTVMAKVNQRWIQTAEIDSKTRIEFTIHRDGKISSVDIAKSCGQLFLDQQARRAVMGADLPPLPQGYQGDTLLIAMNFHYK